MGLLTGRMANENGLSGTAPKGGADAGVANPGARGGGVGDGCCWGEGTGAGGAG